VITRLGESLTHIAADPGASSDYQADGLHLRCSFMRGYAGKYHRIRRAWKKHPGGNQVAAVGARVTLAYGS
jgi:hypothetical protein